MAWSERGGYGAAATAQCLGNIGYAGFIGSVTAMMRSIWPSAKCGKGEAMDGNDAELVREVMKRRTRSTSSGNHAQRPRTCEYYFVISDANPTRRGYRRDLGIVRDDTPGQSHPLLPHAIPDAVLMSAGDR